MAESQSGDRSTALGHSHHVNSLGSVGVPNEDHGLKTDLACSHTLSIGADRKCYDVITVTEFSLGLLLASLNLFFAASKDFLSTSLGVEDDSKRSCHIDALFV